MVEALAYDERPSFLTILVIVVLVHCAGIGYVSFMQGAAKPSQKSPIRLIAKTITLNPVLDIKPVVQPKPEKVEKPQAPLVAPQKPPIQKKEAPSKPKPKPQEKKTAVVRKVDEKPVPKVDTKQQALLAKAQESISKIQAKQAMIPAVVPVVASSEEQDEEGSYRDELVSRLKLFLKLPEYGEVKILLTLDRTGRVVALKVLNAESAINRQHVESHLSTFSFSRFGDNFPGEQQHTFTLVLRND